MGASQSNSNLKSRFWRRGMSSTEETERSRSTSSVSDEEEERQSIILASIKTIQDLYDMGELEIPPTTTVKHKPNVKLLDQISLVQCDITKLDVDAIVNAANRSLMGGGGVDGAIHYSAGPKLLDECRTLNGCETGEAKITKGYNLPARHVIHAVGPIYSEKFKKEKEEQLSSCYWRSLELVVENELRHIAFPSISTGIYGYPIEYAARIALDTTRTFLESEQGSKIERVIFVVWSNKDKEVYASLIPEYFPPNELEDIEEPQDTLVSS